MKKNLFRRILSITAAACVTMSIAVSGLAVNAEEEVNYAPNPGFEEGSDTEAGSWGLWPGWDQGSFITKAAEELHGGSRAIKVVLNEEQNYALYAGRDGAAMNVSGAMTLTMWVKYTGITGEGFKIGLERKTKETNADAHVWGETITGSSDGWTQLKLDIPAAEEAIANINIKVEIGKGAGTLLIDDVVLNGEAPLPPEADPTKNYARNPGFEEGSDIEAGNWGLWPGWDQGSFITTAAEEVHGGSRAIKVQLGDTTNYALYEGGINGSEFDLKSAATLTMWVKYTDVTGGFKFGLERKVGDTANDNYFSDMITGSSDGWTQLKLDIPASQMDLTEWIIKVEIDKGAGTLLIDDVELKVGGQSGEEEEIPEDKKPGVSITDAKGQNILTNNGFENNDADWGVVNGASITTSDSHSGAKSVKVVLDGNAPGMWSNLKGEISVDLSKAMKLSFWVKMENVTGDGLTVGVERTCMDADFNVTNANVFSEALNGTSDWKKVTVDIPATEGCYSLVVKANFPEGGTGTAYFDDFHLTTADEKDMNLLNNGGLDKTKNDTEASGWALSPEWPKGKFNHEDVHNGTSSLELALGTDAYTLFQSSGWGVLSYDLKQSMTFSAWVKASSVTGEGVSLKVERKNGDDLVGEAVVSTAVTGTSNGWVQLKVVAPAVTDEVSEIIVSVNAASGSGTVLVDDLQLRTAVASDTENGGEGDDGEGGGSVPTGVAFPALAVLASVTSAAALVIIRKRK